MQTCHATWVGAHVVMSRHSVWQLWLSQQLWLALHTLCHLCLVGKHSCMALYFLGPALVVAASAGASKAWCCCWRQQCSASLAPWRQSHCWPVSHQACCWQTSGKAPTHPTHPHPFGSIERNCRLCTGSSCRTLFLRCFVVTVCNDCCSSILEPALSCK